MINIEEILRELKELKYLLNDSSLSESMLQIIISKIGKIESLIIKQ